MKTTMMSGFTVTALVTAFGTSLFLLNTPERTLASSPDNASTSELTTASSDKSVTETATALSETIAPRILAPSSQQNTTIATTVPHAWQGNRLAVTIRVKNIPVVTLVGTEAELRAAANQQPITSPDSVISRAGAIAEQLNQLGQDARFDAKTITLAYDKTQRLYSIQVQGQNLIPLDVNTVLPDHTRMNQKNALQMANRLRRLLGDAPALDTVAMASGNPTRQILGTEDIGIQTEPSQRQRIRGGIASWYGPGFHGRRTANGERYNQHSLTAAHKSLPFGTQVLVTNLVTGRSVMVRINDRGPFVRGRVIDLSAGAAKAIGVYGSGTAPVALEVVGR